MRRGILGSIAALAAGAGAAYGQAPMPQGPAGFPPAAVQAGDILPVQAGPSPTLMPPVTVGPQGDPLGLGPTAGLGPPPGPMYPNPGPYGAPMFQPPPPGQAGGMGGMGGYGDGCGITAPKWWFGGDYMLTFVTPQPIPYPILTTSSPNQFGLLGAPTTIQLINDEDIRYSAFSGFRLNGGFFGDADRRFGFDISSLYTEKASYRRTFSSTTPGFSPANIPLLARPFIDTLNGPSSLVLANTNIGAGGVDFSTRTQVWSIDPAAIWNIYRSSPGTGCGTSLDFLAGYKFFQIREDIAIESFVNLNQIQVIPIVRPGPFGVPQVVGFRVVPLPVELGGVVTGPPATVAIADRFAVTNRFNGGFIGLRHEARWGMWSLNTNAKIGVGHMHQMLQIQGTTSFVNPQTGVAGSAYGGLYANSTNIGKFDNDEFAVIPELSFNVGLNLTKQLSAYVGYTVVYANRVARPGDQMNPVIDSTTIPFSQNYGDLVGVSGTSNLFNQNEFWLHGVNFGFQVKY